MKNNSTVKQVSRIEYVGPYQIQTTSIMGVNFSARIENYDEKKPMMFQMETKEKTYKTNSPE